MNMCKPEDINKWAMELAVIEASEKKAKKKGVLLTPARYERKAWLEERLEEVYGNAEEYTKEFDVGVNDRY